MACLLKLFFVHSLHADDRVVPFIQAVSFDPRIPNSYFILPSDSTDSIVWNMNTIRGKSNLFSVTVWLSRGAHPVFFVRHNDSFSGEWQKAYDLEHPTPSSSKLILCTSVTTIPIIVRIPYYTMNFNVDYEDDVYYYDTIWKVRVSHARQLIDLFL